MVGNSPVVQWLGLSALTAGGPGSIPGPGTKIPQAMRCGKKKKKVHQVDFEAIKSFGNGIRSLFKGSTMINVKEQEKLVSV